VQHKVRSEELAAAGRGLEGDVSSAFFNEVKDSDRPAPLLNTLEYHDEGSMKSVMSAPHGGTKTLHKHQWEHVVEILVASWVNITGAGFTTSRQVGVILVNFICNIVEREMLHNSNTRSSPENTHATTSNTARW
jgi:hypothetical protein